MSSKRHIRRKACDGKRRHASQAAAIEHIRSLHRSGKPGKMNTYRCQFCGGYHVGHRQDQNPAMHQGRRP